MRIAILSWTARRAGGVESYLDVLIPALREQGHDLAFVHEVDVPRTRERLTLPGNVTVISAETAGVEAALAQLREWKPDVLYAHGFADPDLEARAQAIAPAVFFLHNYYGACISGHKAFAVPTCRPCTKPFDAACLLYYFPRRCGGLSPVTMAVDFARQRRRQALLRNYHAIVTHSTHMQQEYERYRGLEGRVQTIPYFTHAKAEAPSGIEPRMDTGSGPVRLAFVGRLEPLKGARTLLAALPAVAAAVGRPLHLDVLGAGSDRAHLETVARALTGRHRGIGVALHGWCEDERVRELLGEADLLVVPSLWPEPFGLVGLEAARLGVPVVAFEVGGVTEWLKDGVNGFLAPGDPPTASGLAGAIARCFSAPGQVAALRAGAHAVFSANADFAAHLEVLLGILESTAGRRVAG